MRPAKKAKVKKNKDDIVLEEQEDDIEDMLPEYANEENKKLNHEIRSIKRQISQLDQQISD